MRMPLKLLAVLGTIGAAAAGPALGQFSAAQYSERSHAPRFVVETTLFAFDPKDPIATYNAVFTGSLAGKSENRLQLGRPEGECTVNISSAADGERLPVTVDVIPEPGEKRVKAMRRTLDLSDLRPQQLDLLLGGEGRLYRLNLVPRVGGQSEPARPLRPEDTIYRWNIGGPVFINGEYRGQMGVSGGPIAFLSLPDDGVVHFSLLPFEGATPMGDFLPGTETLVLRSQKDALVIINGVRLGRSALGLPDDPLEVWALWGPPEKTRAQLKSEVEEYISRSPSVSPEEREGLLTKARRGEVIGHGTRGGALIIRQGRLEVDYRPTKR